MSDEFRSDTNMWICHVLGVVMVFYCLFYEVNSFVFVGYALYAINSHIDRMHTQKLKLSVSQSGIGMEIDTVGDDKNEMS